MFNGLIGSICSRVQLVILIKGFFAMVPCMISMKEYMLDSQQTHWLQLVEKVQLNVSGTYLRILSLMIYSQLKQTYKTCVLLHFFLLVFQNSCQIGLISKIRKAMLDRINIESLKAMLDKANILSLEGHGGVEKGGKVEFSTNVFGRTEFGQNILRYIVKQDV